MHVILFDIDGTLIHSRGAGRSALRQALADDFGIESPNDDVPVEGRTDRGITRDLFSAHQIDETPENWQKFRDAYLRHLPAQLKNRPGTVLPGILSLLETLHASSHVTLGLLTGNTRRGARIKLSHFGIDHYFDFGGFGDHHYQRNDVAREALQEVHARHGADFNADRVWVIGDTALDVQCARSIGARAIAVGTGGHTLEELRTAQPDHLFADLSDSAPLQALWN